MFYSIQSCSFCSSHFLQPTVTAQGQKRRLVDSCGHERCYSCLFRQEECSVCRAQGKAAAREQDNLYKSMDPDCLYGSTGGPGGWRGMTPPSGRRTPAPSPRAGGRRTWVQRHSRRPNTVSIDDNTMSGKSVEYSY